jgi:hypothetical protein
MKKAKKTIRSGLTLVELLIAAAVACIVLIAAGIILVYGQKSWNYGLRQAGLQRDASFAMLKMKQSISSGKQAQLDADGLGVKIVQTSGWIRYWYVPGENDLRFQSEGQDVQTLLDGVVDDASFEIDPNTGKMVIVEIQLQKNGSQAHISSQTMMRNFGS